MLQPDRLGLLRPAGRERRDQARRWTLASGRTPNIETQAETFRRLGLRRSTGAPRLHTSRPRVLPLERSGCSCSCSRGRPGLPQGGAGQLVPEGPDRAGQRAGRSAGAASGAARVVTQARADPVVLRDHRVRAAPAGRHGPARGRLAEPRADDAAQLDRPLRGRAHRLRGSTDRRRRGPGLHDPTGHAVRRDLPRGRRRTPARRRAVRAGAARRRSTAYRAADGGAHRDRAAGDRPPEDGRARWVGYARQPDQRRAHADLRRRLRAGRLRHGGDHGRARARRARPRTSPGRTTCRSRVVVAPSGPTPARPGSPTAGPATLDQLRPLRRAADRGRRRRSATVHRRHGRARPGRLSGDLPAARLAGLAPALLGHADPGRPLRRRAAWCPCPRTSCPCCCPTTGYRAAPGRRPVPAGARRGLGRRARARPAAAGPRATPTRWTRSSTRPGTSCAIPTRTTHDGPFDPARRGALAAGRRSTSAAIEHAIRSTCCTRGS